MVVAPAGSSIEGGKAGERAERRRIFYGAVSVIYQCLLKSLLTWVVCKERETDIDGRMG
jgi:hypothetical protein